MLRNLRVEIVDEGAWPWLWLLLGLPMAAAASSPARLGGTDTHGKRPRNSSTDEEQEEEARRQVATQGTDHLGLHGDMEDQDDDDQ